MLLLVLASLRVLVTEDEVNLVGGAALVRAEHDDVGRGVGELFGVEGLVVLEELHVGTTTLEASLELDLILDDEGVILVGDSLGEFGGDGVVGSLVLQDQTLVAVDASEDGRLLDVPGADVLPLLLGVLLLGIGSLPSGFPVVGELLEEGSFEGSGL